MKNFLALFNKVGGKEILKQYLRGHVLLFALTQTLLQGFSKKSLEIVRLSVNNKILSKLRKKYARFIGEFKDSYQPAERKRSNKVWVCWLQGMEQAPELVQACFASLKKHLKDREIILLTEENYRDYVNFPNHIQQKIDSGIITRTHMSDLLRLELLLKYGGSWIDATVYCSGGEIPDYMLDSDLFVFQNLKPGADGHSKLISSWFMTACTNHPILQLTQALLYRYWEKQNAMVDYFLIHDFFQLAIEAYKEEWSKVIPFSNAVPHILLLRLFELYSEVLWTAVKKQTPFHKLSYKFSQEQRDKENTLYKQIITSGGNYGKQE